MNCLIIILSRLIKLNVKKNSTEGECILAKKKRNRKSIKNNGYKLEELGIQKDDITKEELIDIYADAYYKALKRIENESKSENEPEHKVKKI